MLAFWRKYNALFVYENLLPLSPQFNTFAYIHNVTYEWYSLGHTVTVKVLSCDFNVGYINRAFARIWLSWQKSLFQRSKNVEMFLKWDACSLVRKYVFSVFN